MAAQIKSSRGFISSLKQSLGVKDKSFEELKETIEEQLLLADFGVSMTDKIIAKWREEASFVGDEDRMINSLAQILISCLAEFSQSLEITTDNKPFSVLVMGVNGSGKTTSLAKLAYYYQKQGLNLHLAAGDTYRAAAVDQLLHWGHRLNIPVTKGKAGTDSAAVIYEGMQEALSNRSDIYLMDTAGRMPDNRELTEQLQKLLRVVDQLKPGAPDEILLVLDGSHGQSALMQARVFCDLVPVSGILLTKLDGNSKGGSIFAIVEELRLPIRFIGIGEKQDDLLDFSPETYVQDLLEIN